MICERRSYRKSKNGQGTPKLGQVKSSQKKQQKINVLSAGISFDIIWYDLQYENGQQSQGFPYAFSTSLQLLHSFTISALIFFWGVFPYPNLSSRVVWGHCQKLVCKGRPLHRSHPVLCSTLRRRQVLMRRSALSPDITMQLQRLLLLCTSAVALVMGLPWHIAYPQTDCYVVLQSVIQSGYMECVKTKPIHNQQLTHIGVEAFAAACRCLPVTWTLDSPPAAASF